MGVSSDLSDLDTQKNQIKLLLDSTAEGIIGTDNNGLITFVNETAQKTLAFKKNLKGLDICLFLELGKDKDKCIHFDQLHSGKTIHEVDSVLLLENKQTLAIEYWLRAVTDKGKMVGLILTFINITKRKLAENKLQQTLMSLEDKVEQRTAQLRTKINELEQTRENLIQSEKMASLGRMVAGFAHEINTPIGIAVGGSSHTEDIAKKLNKLLQQDEVDIDVLVDYINIVQESSSLTLSSLHRAAKLVASFKRTAVDKSSLDWHLFNLSDVLSDVLTSLGNLFKRTQINMIINCPADLNIYSQAGSIEQVLTNLLQNSYRHGFNDGQDKGEIIISANVDNDNLSLIYKDSGKGMDQQSLDKIFEPFYTTARSKGGSGLGMYICYNLVTTELHGDIVCSSKLGQGCQFDMNIPLTQPENSV